MLLTFSGRKNAGKRKFAKIAEESGFTRITFQSIFDEICDQINGSGIYPFHLGNSKIAFSKEELSNQLRLDAFEKNDTFYLKLFNSKFERLIMESKVVLDDLKTKKEKEYLKKYEPVSFFVANTADFEIYNSKFECDLIINDFEDVIFVRQNKGCRSIYSKFKRFLYYFYSNISKNGLSAHFKSKKEMRDALREHMKSRSNELFLSKYDKNSLSRYYMIYFLDKRRRKHEIDESAFSKFDEETAYCAGLFCSDGCVRKSKFSGSISGKFSSVDIELVNKFHAFLKSSRKLDVSPIKNSRQKIMYESYFQSPSIIENLKLWNIKPNKSTKEEVPYPVLDNEKLLKSWIVGMIDGDGCIRGQNKQLNLHLLCSDEIADYISSKVPAEIRRSIIRIKTKNNLSMSRLFFHTHSAVDFYNWLGRPEFGLNRKWSKIKEFISNPSKRRSERSCYSIT